eukprot:CAMPEP_0183414548 /NCGR_PEP_ID=MMETSP0370-20130417/22465_1 /TAXON_ID=268820 /ORGANISM="Peridinium aciculiferum, Strain PAER-2" /LENGTH=39 /DNA_ID= /DNA_START= /DNA_END= /DNA_ORIENTATION=
MDNDIDYDNTKETVYNTKGKKRKGKSLDRLSPLITIWIS